MTKKRLALNTDGKITYCRASEENIGKGRCNHIEHQLDSETQEQFMDRTANIEQKSLQSSRKINIPNRYNYILEDKIIDAKEDGFQSRDEMEEYIGGVTDKFFNKESREFFKSDGKDPSGKDKNQGLREDLISKLLIYSNIQNPVQYDSKLMKVSDDRWDVGTISRDYTEGHFDEVTGSTLLMRYSESQSVPMQNEDYFYEDLDIFQMHKQINMINQYTKSDYSKEMLQLWAMDHIVLNDDRVENNGNYGVLKDYDTGEAKPMPPFDWGDSFMTNIDEIDSQMHIKRLQRFKIYAETQWHVKGPLLEFNKEDMQNYLKSYSNDLYNDKDVKNIIDNLNKSLAMTEGILWKGV